MKDCGLPLDNVNDPGLLPKGRDFCLPSTSGSVLKGPLINGADELSKFCTRAGMLLSYHRPQLRMQHDSLNQNFRLVHACTMHQGSATRPMGCLCLCTDLINGVHSGLARLEKSMPPLCRSCYVQSIPRPTHMPVPLY